MLRQREKFERIDVPRDNNPYRNIIGAGVVVAVCIVVTLICITLWNRVQLESHLGDHGLNSALAQQKVSSDEVAGYTRSQDEFTSVLLLTTDKLRGEGCKLQAASLLVLNKSAGPLRIPRMQRIRLRPWRPFLKREAPRRVSHLWQLLQILK